MTGRVMSGPTTRFSGRTGASRPVHRTERAAPRAAERERWTDRN